MAASLPQAPDVRVAVRDVPGVFRDAGRVLLRHWPALLTLAFLGAALRAGALWLAVAVSDHVGFLGQLILVLAPIGYLLPVVAMLHLCRASLPHLRALHETAPPTAATEGRPRRLVDVAVSVLVPFLAVYVSYGLLDDDLARFRNQAAFDEFTDNLFGGVAKTDYLGRLGIYPVQVAVMIVLVAWVLRWALGRVENLTRFLALAFVGALVEVYYTGQVAGQSVAVKTDGAQWLERRRVVAAVTDRYDALIEHLGPLGHPVDLLTGAIGSLIGSLDAVVVVPVGWLTVAAVVLGHRLAEDQEKQAADDRRRRRLDRLPEGLQRTVRSFGADVRERWSAFWDGLKLLAGAGLAPMLAFGVVFLLAIRVPTLVAELVRALVGPVQTDTYLAFAPMEDALGLALSITLTVPLLAAALDWLVAPRLLAQAAGEPGVSPDPVPAG